MQYNLITCIILMRFQIKLVGPECCGFTAGDVNAFHETALTLAEKHSVGPCCSPLSAKAPGEDAALLM